MAAVLWVSTAAETQCAPADPSPRRRRCAVAVAAASPPRPAADIARLASRQLRASMVSIRHGACDPWRSTGNP